jgi:murein L,D-transpeptidase YcbB/YkuD
MDCSCRVIGLLCAIALARPGAGLAQASTEELQADLERLLASERPAGLNDAQWVSVRRFYTARDFPAWTADSTDTRLPDLLDRLHQADAQGLDSTDYGIPRLRRLAVQRDKPDSLALLDLLATAALLRYASDLAFGRVMPAVVDTMWTAAPRSVDLLGRLAAALDSDRVGPALDDLASPQKPAARLRVALARYRAIAARGGWPELAPGSPLRAGDSGPGVALLRRRLEATGDLASGGAAEVFDSAVADGVRRAQARHGLTPDGVAGGATVAALDVSVQDRIRQIEANLERWRWLPRDLGSPYLMINSAGFTLEIVESGRVTFSGRIVAGRVDWPTPIVSSRLTDVTFSPRWRIPRSIAIQEILPVVRRDPDYLLREGIHVWSDTTPQAVELDVGTIAWDSIPDSAFAFGLWQEPGPLNPLGRIRFSISNRFGVALHDTREPRLFDALARAFSHGCVRVADAERLAIYVLRNVPGWSPDWVRAAAMLPAEWRVAAPDSLPTYLGYWTAWVGSDGTVEFRPDVYGWDGELEAALRGDRAGRR